MFTPVLTKDENSKYSTHSSSAASSTAYSTAAVPVSHGTGVAHRAHPSASPVHASHIVVGVNGGCHEHRTDHTQTSDQKYPHGCIFSVYPSALKEKFAI
ncbi:hypothetical protein DPMN_146363 [Dreissena polymorpha]|uniref:Uncharacterized protein n=1 Tax=Dreissena polymorpha TaxID=45954 RepID=A0A9D4F5P9_DREPO|nr:hypothetical protein DPMN_146363 [Dreissena polymorpha]